MKIIPKKRIVRGEVKWCITISHEGKRRRKFFDSFAEARNFDVMAWLKSISEREPTGTSTLLSVAIPLYVHDYQKRYPGSRTQQIEQRLSVLCDWYPNHKVEDLNPKDIARRIQTKDSWVSPSTKNTAKTIFQIFLKWCSHLEYASERDWTISLLKSKTTSRSVGILTPDQAKDLLCEINPKYQPALAIMLFAGLRPLGEMSKLNYYHIKHGEYIDVPESKTPERLIADLPENLWGWVPKTRSGLVMPGWDAMNQSRRRACSRLGFKYPADGARHSFGTYGYWLKGMEWTMHTMGHSNFNTFQKHYRNRRITKADSDQYFSISGG